MNIFTRGILAAAFAALVGILPAKATTLNFDTLATPLTWGSTPNAWDDFTTYGGMSWNGFEVMNHAAYQANYADSTPLPSGPNFAYSGNDTASLDVTSVSPFLFDGAMLAGWPNIGAPGSLSSVTITGFLGATQVGQLTQSLTPTVWTSVGGLSGPVDKLTFAPSTGYFRLDNLQVSDVPEPMSIALLGSGLVILGGLKQRRRPTTAA